MARTNGEVEWELESEFEASHEGGMHEFEFEGLHEGGLHEGIHEAGLHEYEFEGAHEGEEFFKRIARGIGSFVKRAAPILKSVARIAAPMVGTAVGGPLGGMIGKVASSALGEGEMEYEGEFEAIHEGGQHEFEYEMEAEAAAPNTHHEALAEFMAAVASKSATEAEAEAMVGAATVATISMADRAALRRILPHLVRGTAILTRILRRRAITRPAVRAVPTIVRRTVHTLARRAQAGRPITRRAAARAMATQTQRVLASPRTCALAIQSNVRATRAVRRSMRPSANAISGVSSCSLPSAATSLLKYGLNTSKMKRPPWAR